MIGDPQAPSQLVYEGAFAFQPPYYTLAPGGPPYASVDAGQGSLQAGTMPGQSGIAAGRFGWANPADGIVLNTRVTAQDQLGVVISRRVNWESAYWSKGSRWLRTGYNITMMGNGAFWLRFPAGAFRGDVVYADLTDGHAISGGTPDNAELTKFFVTSGCIPGGLAQVSSFARFT